MNYLKYQILKNSMDRTKYAKYIVLIMLFVALCQFGACVNTYITGQNVDAIIMLMLTRKSKRFQKI
jgi:hypothetical protein